MMKKILILLGGCLIVIGAWGFINFIKNQPVEEGTIFNDFDAGGLRTSSEAKFEYILEKDERYIRAYSAAGSPLNHYFYGLDFVETNEPADEEWIYRITYNYNKGIDGAVVLLSEDSLSVDGIKYVADVDDPEEYYQLIFDQIAHLYEKLEEYKVDFR